MSDIYIYIYISKISDIFCIFENMIFSHPGHDIVSNCCALKACTAAYRLRRLLRSEPSDTCINTNVKHRSVHTRLIYAIFSRGKRRCRHYRVFQKKNPHIFAHKKIEPFAVESRWLEKIIQICLFTNQCKICVNGLNILC